jgi:hypothetical protein
MVSILRLARVRTGLPGVRFALKIGMNPDMYARVERRSWVCPVKWRPVLSEVLGVPVETLFDEYGFSRPDRG